MPNQMEEGRKGLFGTKWDKVTLELMERRRKSSFSGTHLPSF